MRFALRWCLYPVCGACEGERKRKSEEFEREEVRSCVEWGLDLMLCNRRRGVEGRGDGAAGEGEKEKEEIGRSKASSERYMQLRGVTRASGLSVEGRTLRRKPQLHVNCSERRVPPHPGGVGR